MKTFDTCPCGITKVDCDYHRPEQRSPVDQACEKMFGKPCRCGKVWLGGKLVLYHSFFVHTEGCCLPYKPS